MAVTLFQVWTLESWSEAVARPLVFSRDAHVASVACIFFPLYNLVNTVFLLNVLTSIFVDQMTTQSEATRAELAAEERRWAEEQAASIEHRRSLLAAQAAGLPLRSLLFVKKLRSRAELTREERGAAGRQRAVELRLERVELKLDALLAKM